MATAGQVRSFLHGWSGVSRPARARPAPARLTHTQIQPHTLSLPLSPCPLSPRGPQAIWLDDGGKARVLVLWRPLAAWADAVAAWAQGAGMAGQVITVDELATEEANGTGASFLFFFVEGRGLDGERRTSTHSRNLHLPLSFFTQTSRVYPASSSSKLSSSSKGGVSPSAFDLFLFFSRATGGGSDQITAALSPSTVPSPHSFFFKTHIHRLFTGSSSDDLGIKFF
jgi:hypothetical protein